MAVGAVDRSRAAALSRADPEADGRPDLQTTFAV